MYSVMTSPKKANTGQLLKFEPKRQPHPLPNNSNSSLKMTEDPSELPIKSHTVDISQKSMKQNKSSSAIETSARKHKLRASYSTQPENSRDVSSKFLNPSVLLNSPYDKSNVGWVDNLVTKVCNKNTEKYLGI